MVKLGPLNAHDLVTLHFERLHAESRRFWPSPRRLQEALRAIESALQRENTLEVLVPPLIEVESDGEKPTGLGDGEWQQHSASTWTVADGDLTLYDRWDRPIFSYESGGWRRVRRLE